jgi:hypothetical protein
MEGGWQQDVSAAELRVSRSAISKPLKDCQASTSDHSLQDLSKLCFAEGTKPCAETRRNRRRITTGRALASTTRRIPIDMYSYLDFSTNPGLADPLEDHPMDQNLRLRGRKRIHNRGHRNDATYSDTRRMPASQQVKLAWASPNVHYKMPSLSLYG